MDPNPNRRPQNPFDLFRNDPFLNNRDLDPFNTPFFQNSPLFRQRVQMPSTFRSDFQSNIPLRDDSEEDDDERQMQEAIRRSRQEAESKNSNQQSSRQPLIEEPSSDTEFERNRILAQVERDFPAAGHSPAHTPINVTSQYGSRYGELSLKIFLCVIIFFLEFHSRISQFSLRIRHPIRKIKSYFF